MLEASNTMQALGINSVFDMKIADLSRMVNLREVFVKEIIHKTHIEVDRSGTKAAAYTEVVMEVGCAPLDIEEVKEVRLDRPFAFAIMNNETGFPIFVGRVNYVNQET